MNKSWARGFYGIYLALIASVFLGFWGQNPFTSLDPDRYYHFSLSREMVEQQIILRTVPQVENLHWGKYFPDKEFFFHVLTATTYKFTGESGIPLLINAIALGILFFLFRGGSAILSLHRAFALFTIFLIASPLFMLRLNLIRPHVLAVFFFVVLAIGLIQKNKTLCVIGAFFFSLSYHAFYVPLTLLGSFGISAFFKKDRSLNKLIAFAALAIFGGLLLNPYFPSNIVMGWKHALIAFKQGENASLAYGQELLSPGISFSFRNFLPFGVLLFSSFYFFWKRLASLEALALLFFCTCFWLLFFVSPRAIEYAVPATFLLSVIALKEFPERMFRLVLLVCAITQAFNMYVYLRESSQEKSVALLSNANRDHHEIVKAIPITVTGEKIYHCNWSVGPYIFYHRPDLRFVDILDPSLLLSADKEIFAARELLNIGKIKDPYEMIKKVFMARYIICDSSALNQQLLRDERFELLYKTEQGNHLFALH